jgi:hypothetical protein
MYPMETVLKIGFFSKLVEHYNKRAVSWSRRMLKFHDYETSSDSICSVAIVGFEAYFSTPAPHMMVASL